MNWCFSLPVNQNVPLGQAESIGACGCPTASKSQNQIWIRSAKDLYVHVDRISQYLCHRIVSIRVERGVGCRRCGSKQTLRHAAFSNVWQTYCLCQTTVHWPSSQPFVWHCPLAICKYTLRGPSSAMERGLSGGCTSTTRVSTDVARYLHWKSSLTKRTVLIHSVAWFDVFAHKYLPIKH